jgi:hypothetical protein
MIFFLSKPEGEEKAERISGDFWGIWRMPFERES